MNNMVIRKKKELCVVERWLVLWIMLVVLECGGSVSKSDLFILDAFLIHSYATFATSYGDCWHNLNHKCGH